MNDKYSPSPGSSVSGENDDRNNRLHSVSDSDEPEDDSGTSTPKLPDNEDGEHRFTRFACSSDFESVKWNSSDGKSSLRLEDVQKSSKELWLIQAPHDFDFENLSGQQVLLNAQQILNSNASSSNQGNKKYDVYASSQDKVSAPHIILPSHKTKKLSPGPAFQGHITITESVAVPGVSFPHTPPTKQEIPRGLKQRFVPFGWDEPVIYNPNTPPHTPAREETDSSSSSPRKKKKKKKIIKKEVVEEGDAPKDQTASSQEHRKAHKRKIKTEMPDSDVPVKTKRKKKQK